jgi:Zn-dependent protease with chaperone function
MGPIRYNTSVFEIDASRQTTRMSANVSGFGSTMRITLNDNLLRRGSPEEIQAVMSHEMGHYVLHHIYRDILFFGVVLVIGFALLQVSLAGEKNGEFTESATRLCCRWSFCWYPSSDLSQLRS